MTWNKKFIYPGDIADLTGTVICREPVFDKHGNVVKKKNAFLDEPTFGIVITSHALDDMPAITIGLTVMLDRVEFIQLI